MTNDEMGLLSLARQVLLMAAVVAMTWTTLEWLRVLMTE
jgi:hypothetical protein